MTTFNIADNNPLLPIIQFIQDKDDTITALTNAKADSDNNTQQLQAQLTASQQSLAATQSQLDAVNATLAAQQAHDKFYQVLERGFYYMGLNVPYSQASQPSLDGMDCSSFMQQIFGDCGIKLPRLAGDQLDAGTAVDMSDESKWPQGVLLIFRFKNATTRASHVGMYIGNGLIIHTALPGTGIIVRRWKDYYADDLIGVRNVLGS